MEKLEIGVRVIYVDVKLESELESLFFCDFNSVLG